MANNIVIATTIIKRIQRLAVCLLVIFLLTNCNNLNSPVHPSPQFSEEELTSKKVERVQKFIQEATRNAEHAKGKDIVLIMGNTGAGKSTIINYVLGSKMKKIYNEDIDESFAEPEDASKHWARIGNGAESQTLLPSTHNSPYSNVTYCDCPGFHDTRTEEDRLNITIATQLMVKAAKSIKGIIVVIDKKELESRATTMRSVSLAISQLFQGKISPNSILFAFNNKDSNTKARTDQILKKVEMVKKSEESKLEKLTISSQGGEESEKVLQVISLLNLISQKNSFLVDVFDNFESKKQAEELLQNIAATPKDSFSFSVYDNARVKFDRQLAKIASKVANKLIEFVQANEDLHTNTELLASCKIMIAIYQNHLQQLERAAQVNFNNNEEELKILENQVQKHKNNIEKLKAEKQEIQNKIKKLTTQKEELNTDEEVLHWQDNGKSFLKDYGNKKGSFSLGTYSFIPYYEKKSFEYKDGPFSRISYSIHQGNFEDELIDKEKGIYHGTFVACDNKNKLYYKEGHATVSIYGKKKDNADNKKLIHQLEVNIKEEQTRIENYDQKLQKAYLACKNIQELIETNKNEIARKKIEQNKSREAIQEKIKKAEQEKNDLETTNQPLNIILKEIKEYIISQESLINAILSFTSQQICRESSLFGILKKYYQTYQNPQILRDLSTEDNYPEDLECPLTYEIFTHPITTKCNHTFSAAKLLQHLEKGKPCPMCNQAVSMEELVENTIIQRQIEEFRSQKASTAKKQLEEAQKQWELK